MASLNSQTTIALGVEAANIRLPHQTIVYRERRVSRVHELLAYVIGVLIGAAITQVINRYIPLGSGHAAVMLVAVAICGYGALAVMRHP